MPEKKDINDAELPPLTVKPKYRVAMVVYEGFTMMDLIGPAEVLTWDQEKFVQVVVGLEANSKVRSMNTAFQFEPTMSFEQAAQLEGEDKFDMMVVPGGTYGPEKAANDPKFMKAFVALANKVDVVLTVCTGSIVLAKSGLIDGKQATTNKMCFQRYKEMFPKVDWKFKARWVHSQDGKFITASGLTAGIDAALYFMSRLFGKDYASMISTGLEFAATWNPDEDPFADFVEKHKPELPARLFEDPSLISN